MFQQTQSNNDLPRNYLQFHENAFVSPLNLINVTHPAPISFGRAPHFLQQTIPRFDTTMPSSSSPQLQSIDTNKLNMYQFLAKRKLKEDQWKKEMNEKNPVQPTFQQRNVRSSQSQQRSKNPSIRSTSVPKKPIVPKKDNRNEINRSPRTPTPIHITRPNDPYAALSIGKQNEIIDIHEQLLVQLRILHSPPARENIIDETEQEKQRRIRLKRERIKRDSRAIYNAHQELKQIINDAQQSDANFPRLIHRHLNAYKAILLAVETLANEAPLKPQDTPIQQLLTALLPVLETLTNANYALRLSQLNIDPSFLHNPPSKNINRRPISDNRASPSNQLLPTIYNELIKKKQQQQQRKPRVIPSVLRPRSAESVRLPRTDTSSITRSTISIQNKARPRSHSPLPSIKSASTIETPFYSRYTIDHILGKLAPRLLANYTGRELSEQIERARTLIPMFLVDNRLTDDEIVTRVIQMLMPRQQQQQVLTSTTSFEVLETPEERARRANLDIYQTQISTWEDEMSQIRQRIQNYKTNRLEQDTTIRRTVKFQSDPIETSISPENVHIHRPHLEYTLDDFVTKSNENKQAFEKTIVQSSSRGYIRLHGLDSSKIRQIERYQRDFRNYLQRTEAAKQDDFDPCQVINRLSEFLLDEALLSVVNEVELLTIELSQKLVENELLGREISLADVEKEQKHQYRRPLQQVDRKHSPISPSSLNERYTSSFEEDINTESKISRSEDDENIPRRKSPMEGTGRFTTTTTTAFEQRKLSRNQLSSSASSTSSPSDSEKGIILKPTIVVKKPSSAHEDNDQFSDRDADSSISSKPKGRQQQLQHQSSVDDDDDDDLLLSTKTGEKIYSTDFEESKSKPRNISNYDDEDDDVADTMKLSARSLKTTQRHPFDSDDDDDDD
ncbi:unnamed protein product [Rotaria sp. Silwood2]|nr:unnamed protein product [Rotaria sp. Silwood2]CAF3286037.1 unnamed protein product [Rotaria sp. Silwood2]CAF4112242.1 unnamed protein product [Rotaria sp. Silwood2]